jgi:hypothetical protein
MAEETRGSSGNLLVGAAVAMVSALLGALGVVAAALATGWFGFASTDKVIETINEDLARRDANLIDPQDAPIERTEYDAARRQHAGEQMLCWLSRRLTGLRRPTTRPRC